MMKTVAFENINMISFKSVECWFLVFNPLNFTMTIQVW